MFTLDRVVPWGRSFREYVRMFALSDEDLRSKVLGCGDGPASFNVEATRGGASVISCDPIYQYDADQLRGRIASTYDEILEQTRRNTGEFVWTEIRSVDELGRVRMAAMNEFLADYESGGREGRYEVPAPFRPLRLESRVGVAAVAPLVGTSDAQISDSAPVALLMSEADQLTTDLAERY